MWVHTSFCWKMCTVFYNVNIKITFIYFISTPKLLDWSNLGLLDNPYIFFCCWKNHVDVLNVISDFGGIFICSSHNHNFIALNYMFYMNYMFLIIKVKIIKSLTKALLGDKEWQLIFTCILCKVFCYTFTKNSLIYKLSESCIFRLFNKY